MQSLISLERTEEGRRQRFRINEIVFDSVRAVVEKFLSDLNTNQLSIDQIEGKLSDENFTSMLCMYRQKETENNILMVMGNRLVRNHIFEEKPGMILVKNRAGDTYWDQMVKDKKGMDRLIVHYRELCKNPEVKEMYGMLMIYKHFYENTVEVENFVFDEARLVKPEAYGEDNKTMLDRVYKERVKDEDGREYDKEETILMKLSYSSLRFFFQVITRDLIDAHYTIQEIVDALKITDLTGKNLFQQESAGELKLFVYLKVVYESFRANSSKKPVLIPLYEIPGIDFNVKDRNGLSVMDFCLKEYDMFASILPKGVSIADRVRAFPEFELNAIMTKVNAPRTYKMFYEMYALTDETIDVSKSAFLDMLSPIFLRYNHCMNGRLRNFSQAFLHKAISSGGRYTELKFIDSCAKLGAPIKDMRFKSSVSQEINLISFLLQKNKLQSCMKLIGAGFDTRDINKDVFKEWYVSQLENEYDTYVAARFVSILIYKGFDPFFVASLSSNLPKTFGLHQQLFGNPNYIRGSFCSRGMEDAVKRGDPNVFEHVKYKKTMDGTPLVFLSPTFDALYNICVHISSDDTLVDAKGRTMLMYMLSETKHDYAFYVKCTQEPKVSRFLFGRSMSLWDLEGRNFFSYLPGDVYLAELIVDKHMQRRRGEPNIARNDVPYKGVNTIQSLVLKHGLSIVRVIGELGSPPLDNADILVGMCERLENASASDDIEAIKAELKSFISQATIHLYVDTMYDVASTLSRFMPDVFEEMTATNPPFFIEVVHRNAITLEYELENDSAMFRYCVVRLVSSNEKNKIGMMIALVKTVPMSLHNMKVATFRTEQGFWFVLFCYHVFSRVDTMEAEELKNMNELTVRVVLLLKLMGYDMKHRFSFISNSSFQLNLIEHLENFDRPEAFEKAFKILLENPEMREYIPNADQYFQNTSKRKRTNGIGKNVCIA